MLLINIFLAYSKLHRAAHLDERLYGLLAHPHAGEQGAQLLQQRVVGLHHVHQALLDRQGRKGSLQTSLLIRPGEVGKLNVAVSVIFNFTSTAQGTT